MSIFKDWSDVKRTPACFDEALFHIYMLKNHTKYMQFAEAMRERVNGSRVLEVGCGSGILSLLAVRFGAASVTAIERWPVSVFAKEVFSFHPNERRRITLIQDDFFNIKANAKYDVIISETVGYFGFEENIWAIMAHAAKEWSHNGTLYLPLMLSITPVLNNISTETESNQVFLSNIEWPKLSRMIDTVTPAVYLNTEVPSVIKFNWSIQPRCSFNFNAISFIVNAQFTVDNKDNVIGNRKCTHWPRCVIKIAHSIYVTSRDIIHVDFRSWPHWHSSLIKITICLNDKIISENQFLAHSINLPENILRINGGNTIEQLVNSVEDVLRVAG